MNPDMWYVELALGSSKVHVGCNGRVMWYVELALGSSKVHAGCNGRLMWYVELALGSSKVHAGCNGWLVWRHTSWLGAHAAKGPVRSLRCALQVRERDHDCALGSIDCNPFQFR